MKVNISKSEATKFCKKLIANLVETICYLAMLAGLASPAVAIAFIIIASANNNKILLAISTICLIISIPLCHTISEWDRKKDGNKNE